MDERTREYLKDQLATLRKAQSHLEVAMQPYVDAISAICQTRDALLEQHVGGEVDTCGGCAEIILPWDDRHICMDGDPVFCVACAPTFGEILADEKDNTGREDYAELMAFIQAHLDGGGSLDDKVLHGPTAPAEAAR